MKGGELYIKDKININLLIIVGSIILMVFIAALLGQWFKVGAIYNNFPKTICHHTPSNQVTLTFQNQQSYNGHLGTPHSGQTYDTNGACVNPSPTPTNTPTLTSTPTPTIEITPTEIPCQECCKEDECTTPTPSVEPSPTTTPSATPTPRQEEHGSSNGTSASNGPVCTTTIDAPLLQGFEVTSSTSVFWHWWPSKSSVSKQWIEYGYSQGNYPYNVFVPSNAIGFEIGALQENLPRWARIGVINDSGCVAYSNDLDP